jgi:hypothetical protein
MGLARTIDHVLPKAPLARVDIGDGPVITALVLHRDLARLDLHAGGDAIVELPRDTIITFPTEARAD